MGWSRFFRRASWDEERARELDAYLEEEIATNLERGMTPQQARNAACRKLGNPTSIREEIYRMNSIGFIETLWRDLRYALRVLRKSPGFTLVAVLSLALGIGANTAIFSLVYAVMLRPLPYPQPDRLVRVAQADRPLSVNIPQFEFWKQNSATFASATGHQGTSKRNLMTGATPELVTVTSVTSDFLRTLGVAPALGREFSAAETRGGGPQAILLSDALWRRSFGADMSVVGRVVVLDAATYTVVGVLPRAFWFPQESAAFVPLRPSGTTGDLGANTEMIARLKPGVGLSQARAEMATLSQSYRRASGDDVRLTVTPYQAWMAGEVRTTLLLLLGAVGLLLLMACANLAGLSLARLAARRKEIALRLALGGSSGRLLQQFVAENLLLGVAGSLAGLAVAQYSLRILLALLPFHLPASAPIRLDLPVLAFTLAIAMGAALLFGLVPSLTSVRLDVSQALKMAGRSTSASGGGHRARSFLVAGQVALSATLLVAAALIIQSLYRLHQEQLGFTPAGLITFRTPTRPDAHKTGAALWEYDRALIERLEAVPGVRSAAAVNVLPLTNQGNYPAQRQGHPEQSIGGMEIRVVTPGYFETMKIALRQGRAFTQRDTAKGPPVILVSETVARQWWGNASPLGDRVEVGRFRGKNFMDPPDAPREVVGVVADTKSVQLKAVPRPTIYLAAAQAWWYDGSMSWVVRASLSPGLAAEVRRAVAEVDQRQRVTLMQTMEEIVASTTADSRFDAWLFGSFAGLALLLASIGVYGLLSFSVAGRTAEFGTRMALGASRLDVLRLVLKQGLALIAIGLAVGLAAAFAATRFLTTLLFGVRPHDVLSFAAVAAVLLAVGLFASYLPARRATKIDPMVALRYE